MHDDPVSRVGIEVLSKCQFAVNAHTAVGDVGLVDKEVGEICGDGNAVGLQPVGVRFGVVESFQRVIESALPVIEPLHQPIGNAGNFCNANFVPIPREQHSFITG